jgi:hypothetical protein
MYMSQLSGDCMTHSYPVSACHHIDRILYLAFVKMMFSSLTRNGSIEFPYMTQIPISVPYMTLPSVWLDLWCYVGEKRQF